MLAWSRVCNQPRFTQRAASQSVNTMMSRPIGWQSPIWLTILAKNSVLSLMSALYLTEIPVSFENLSNEGVRLPLVSMYSGQLLKYSCLSESDWSVGGGQDSGVWAAPAMPQAPSRPEAPTPRPAAAEPRRRERRLSGDLPEPRRSARPGGMGMGRGRDTSDLPHCCRTVMRRILS